MKIITLLLIGIKFIYLNILLYDIMIFSTEIANEVKLSDNSNNTKYLEAGIHDNVKFVSAKFAE